jgi:DNA-binding MarR family transcriptional regulator
MIADALEQRGLARREPNPADRRIRNLALTDRGLEIKAAIEREMLCQMPWTQALDRSEREQFLELVRKMCKTMAAGLTAPAASKPETEVSSGSGVTSPVAH